MSCSYRHALFQLFIAFQVLLSLLLSFHHSSANATVSIRSGSSTDPCAKWTEAKKEYEENSECYNGHVSCCDIYDKIYIIIVELRDMCDIPNQAFFLGLFNQYCIGTDNPQPSPHPSAASTPSSIPIYTTTHTGQTCLPCHCSSCNDCVNGCHKPPIICNTCGCPGYTPCATNPPSCTHCGCSGYEPCTTQPPACTSCGCPGHQPCQTQPPACTSCGCPGYQQCQTHPPACTSCGCPGYSGCNPAPPPCQQTPAPCYTVPPCGYNGCPTVQCTSTPPPCNMAPSPSPAAAPCTGTDCHCGSDNICSCSGLPCSSTDPNANGGNGSSNSGVNPIQTGGECLHGLSKVKLSNGNMKFVHDLQVGDVVQTSSDKYSAIFMFTHHDASAMAKFVELHTSNNLSLPLTYGHFIDVRTKGLRRADQVEVNDEVMTVGSEQGADGWVRIVRIKQLVWKRGLYNPQTLDGHIIVNGLMVSTYTAATDSWNVGHSLLAPLRAVYGLCGLHFSSLVS